MRFSLILSLLISAQTTFANSNSCLELFPTTREQEVTLVTNALKGVDNLNPNSVGFKRLVSELGPILHWESQVMQMGWWSRPHLEPVIWDRLRLNDLRGFWYETYTKLIVSAEGDLVWVILRDYYLEPKPLSREEIAAKYLVTLDQVDNFLELFKESRSQPLKDRFIGKPH